MTTHYSRDSFASYAANLFGYRIYSYYGYAPAVEDFRVT